MGEKIPQINQKQNGNRVVDRLDIQLLITVIVFFVSAWAYLNSIICNFTGSESINIQMSYIFVHYMLTVFLLLSIVLTAIKSFYILNDGDIKKGQNSYRLFQLFLNSWYWIMGICIIMVLLSNAFTYEWLFGLIVICVFVTFRMIDTNYSSKSILITISSFIIGFPLFISVMTSVIRNIEVETDKPFYNYSDKVLVTVNARGYACKHKLVGLSEEYNGAQYYSEKGLIMLNATQIKNNELAIGTVSPTTGTKNFIFYFFYKMKGKEPPYIEIKDSDISAIKKYAHFTPKSIYVKP
jgi:hypothetical protein